MTAVIPAARSGSTVRAFVYYFIGVFSFSVVDAATKLLRGDPGTVTRWVPGNFDLGTWQVILLTRIPPLCVALVLTAQATGSPFRLATGFWKMHLLRGLLVLATTFTFYAGLRYLPLADCIVIAFAAPIFVTALSGPLLGERVGWRRWSAVAVGFAGVVVAVRPDGSVGIGTFLILASAVAYALTLLTLRPLSGKEHSHNILFYSTVFGLVVAIVPAALEWKPISLTAAALIVVQGLASACGQLTMIKAFRIGEASMLAPLEFTALIWAAACGLAFWGDFPTLEVLAGAALIIGANVYIAHREARLAQRKRELPPVPEHASVPE
ncbi:MAG TPA: DMT family transporter [Dongiaceae bacterium]|jgi:drug/metabolite transporter (DMT)-like permease|nr:DMT family transporter [Dongiaceae bacterium]